jgi:hypothetical protein
MTLYLIAIAVGVAFLIAAAVSNVQAGKAKRSKEQAKKENIAKTLGAIGAIAIAYGGMQALSQKMADTTPSWIEEAADLSSQLDAMEAIAIAELVGEHAPGTNILAILPPAVPKDQERVEKRPSIIKGSLHQGDGTLLAGTYQIPWPADLPKSKNSLRGNKLPGWWTAEGLKTQLMGQPFPVGSIISWMPLPEDLPPSDLWSNLGDAWPIIILVDPQPAGLEEYVSRGVVKAAIVRKPGFNPRSITEVPKTHKAYFDQTRIVITAENVGLVKAEFPTLFAPATKPFKKKK